MDSQATEKITESPSHTPADIVNSISNILYIIYYIGGHIP